MTGGRRGARASARHARLASARGGAVFLATVAGLGLLLAVTSGSLPYLVASPAADPNFGALNHCLASVLEGPRLGWAVAPDGSRAAAHGPTRVAVCGPQGALPVLSVPGVTALTFDGEGRLWLAAERRLLREEAPGRLAPVGDFSAVALAGHAGGVLALDSRGQLLSVAADGAVRGALELPAPGGSLSVGPGGALAAVVLGGGVLAYEAGTLAPVRAGAPCAVRGLWWLDADSVLLACGADDALTLSFNLRTGEWDAVPRGPRALSQRLWGRALYVQGCDNLPCTAPAPLGSEPTEAGGARGEVDKRGPRAEEE